MHGANRLAALGFLSFACAPTSRKLAATGWDEETTSFVWPIWTSPMTLTAIEALLANPNLTKMESERLRCYGVAEVVAAKRVHYGKVINVAPARAVEHD